MYCTLQDASFPDLVALTLPPLCTLLLAALLVNPALRRSLGPGVVYALAFLATPPVLVIAGLLVEGCPR